MLTGQECERSRRQQALHCGHSGKGGDLVDSQAAVLPQAFKDRVHARQLAGVVQESGAKDELDESSRSGTLTFNMTHAS